jgi:hypothetical protein
MSPYRFWFEELAPNMRLLDTIFETRKQKRDIDVLCDEF